MAPGLAAGPVTRVCHVCGRQYGLSSFEIHLKQCKKLWVQQEEQKPVKERRPIPKTPPGIGQVSADEGGSGGGMSREEIEALNRAAQEVFNVHGMETCEFCGRTFVEGRLAIHNKSCRGDSVAKKVSDGAVPRNKKEPEVDYGRVRSSDHPRADSSPSETSNSGYRAESGAVGAASSGSTSSTATPQRPTTSGGAARGLSGSLASNRKKLPGQDGGATTRQQIQSPLEQGVDVTTLQQDLQGKEGMISVIQAKLDRWEATTLATLQEIRDLKDVFAQLNAS